MPKASGSGGDRVAKRGGRYNYSVNKAVQQVQQVGAEAAAVEQQVTWAREREKLLVDFIISQEETQHILRLQQSMMAELEEAQPDPAAAIQAALARSVADQRPRTSNLSTFIFAQATAGHIMFVRGMTMQDWCEQGCQSFVKLSALLELCNRDLQPQLTGFEGTDGDADPAAGAGAGGSGGLSQQAAVSAAAVLATPAAAAKSAAFPPAAAAAGDVPAPAPAADPPPAAAPGSSCAAAAAAAAAGAAGASSSPCASPIACLYSSGPDYALLQYVEQTIMAPYAAMFWHPQPYYAAAACNLSTGQVEIMPQAHIMQVVQRLRLSARQVMHLRIINSEFVRLGRVTSREGESLTEHMAKLSLTAVADACEQQQQQHDKGAAGVGADSSGQSGSRGPAAAAAGAGGGSSRSSSKGSNNAAAQAARLAAAVAAEDAATEAAAAAAGAQATAGAAGASMSRTASRAGSACNPFEAASASAVAAVAPAAAAVAAAGCQPDDDDDAAADLLDLQPDGAANTATEAIQRQLERYLRTMHIHTVVTGMCVINTLTPRQLATLSVASMPYAPNVHALAEACMTYTPPAERQQRQQQQQGAQQPDEAPHSNTGAGVLPDVWQRQIDAHMALRNAQLQQQVIDWWRRNSDLARP